MYMLMFLVHAIEFGLCLIVFPQSNGLWGHFLPVTTLAVNNALLRSIWMLSVNVNRMFVSVEQLFVQLAQSYQSW